MGNCHTAGPNEVLVISGGCCGQKGQKMTIGGYSWAWCIVTEVQRLSLEIMTLLPAITSCETKQGVPLNVSAVAQVKIMSDTPEFLTIACEQFLGMDVDDIKALLLDTFEGHLRAIVGSMDVEELFQDREKFADLVREHASADVSKMGIKVLSFTIKDIEDSQGYLDALGQEQTSNIKSKAAILQAAADRAAYIREEECKKEAIEVKYETDTLIADYEKNYETKKAEYLTAVGEAKAEAALSYELESSKQQQKIVAEELNVDLVRKKYSIQVEEKEIIRAEKELISTSTLPAEATAYQTKLMAEANKTLKLNQAQADAQTIRLTGKAEADALEAIGKANALEMSLKAKAFEEYGQAATVKLVLDKLPEIATEVARPLAKIDDIVRVYAKT